MCKRDTNQMKGKGLVCVRRWEEYELEGEVGEFVFARVLRSLRGGAELELEYCAYDEKTQSAKRTPRRLLELGARVRAVRDAVPGKSGEWTVSGSADVCMGASACATAGAAGGAATAAARMKGFTAKLVSKPEKLKAVKAFCNTRFASVVRDSLCGLPQDCVVVILESPALRTVSALERVAKLPRGRIVVPNPFEAEELAAVGAGIQLSPVSLAEYLRSRETSVAVGAMWMDFMGSLWGEASSRSASPRETVDAYFEGGHAVDGAVFALTVCCRHARLKTFDYEGGNADAVAHYVSNAAMMAGCSFVMQTRRLYGGSMLFLLGTLHT